MIYGALKWMYGLQRKMKQDLGRAEARSNVRPEELENLREKLGFIDTIIEVLIKEL